MAEVAEDAASASAAAASKAISETVSAMLDNATTSAAKTPEAQGMRKQLSGLEAGSTAAAGIADTVSSMLESATTAAVAATREQEPQEPAVVAARPSASAAATTSVPPLSPLEPTVEYTASGIELSGRRGRDDEEGSAVDGSRRNDGATADAADRIRYSRGQLEPVIISDAGRLVDDAAEPNNSDEGGLAQNKAAEKEKSWLRQAQSNAKENGGGMDTEENEEEKLGLAEDYDDRVPRSSRAVDGNDHSTHRPGSTNSVQVATEGGGKAERQRGGGLADDNSQAAGECSTAPHDRPSAAARAAPQIAPSQLAEREGDVQQQWQWWDDENPWSRRPRSSTSSDRKAADRKLSGTGPPPPVYQETTPPPPYQEVLAGLRASLSPMQKQSIEHQEGARSSETVTSNRGDRGSVAAASNDTSGSSGDDASRGPPPSYSAAVVGRTASQSSSSDREEEKQASVRNLPPPSYGRFYDDVRSATFSSPLKGETDSSGATSDGHEWWTKGHEDHQYAPVWGGEGRGKERGGGRRRTRASSGGSGGSGGGGGALQKYDRPETVGGEHEEEGLGGTSWRRRQHSEERTGRTAATSGSSRPKTTTPHPRGKSGNKDTTLRYIVLLPSAKREETWGRGCALDDTLLVLFGCQGRWGNAAAGRNSTFRWRP